MTLAKSKNIDRHYTFKMKRFRTSVTRLGDLLDFGQLFKATINLAKSPSFLGNFRKGVKIYHFSREIILGQVL